MNSRTHRPVFVAVAALLAGAVLAQQPPAPPAAPPGPPDTSNLPDTPGTGRYPAMKEEDASLAAHVVYRPRDLGALGSQKLGVVAWGNGGCSDDGASTRLHLLELASHGYLVIASGRILSGPGAPPRAPRPAAAPRSAAAPAETPPATGAAPPPPGQLPPPRTKASDLNDAIDWALKENSRQDSPYFGRIDPKQIAVSGFSCGGLQALTAGADPRVTATILHNTGIFVEGPSAIPGMDIGKDALKKLHTPVLYVLGGPTDIAYKNGMDDFEKINHVPVAVADLPVGHGGTYFQPNGGAAASVAVSWLQWQLRGDKKAESRFVGKDCGLCKDKDWTFYKKQIP